MAISTYCMALVLTLKKNNIGSNTRWDGMTLRHRLDNNLPAHTVKGIESHDPFTEKVSNKYPRLREVGKLYKNIL